MGLSPNRTTRGIHRYLKRRRRSIWVAGVWAAMLLQVHIFFVLQLHHHDGLFNFNSQVFASSSKAPHRPAFQTVNLLCPACQIARHGIVHPMAETLPSGRFIQTERVPGLPTARPYCIPFLKLSGRDPPHC